MSASGRLSEPTGQDNDRLVEPRVRPVVTLSYPAMACRFQIQFGDDHERGRGLDAFELIDRLEQQMSVYRDDSEVRRLNAAAADRPIRVEARLFDLLHRCHDFSRQTGGAFDVTAGPLIRAWGFFQRQGRVPDADELERVRRLVGYRKMHLDAADRSVRFERAGMEVNLGSVGKGYALDRAAEVFRRGADSADRRPGVLLSAGHSSILAVGRPGWDDAWQIDVADPDDLGRTLARVRLHNRGFSTTGVSQQSFVHAGKRYGHVLDPRSGRPAVGTLQASAAAPDAVAAEVLSTAFFVLGADWADHYCREHPDCGAIIVPDLGDSRPGRPLLFGSHGAVENL